MEGMGAYGQVLTGINPHGGAVGTSTSVVAHMAVAVGQPSLQAMDSDPLRWAPLPCVHLFGDSWGQPLLNVASGKVISVHGDGTVATKTSPLVQVVRGSIATGVPIHSSPGSEVGWGLGDAPPQPNAAEPSHRQWCAVPG